MGERGQVSPDLEDYVDGLKHLEISVRKRLVDLCAKHLWRHQLKTWTLPWSPLNSRASLGTKFLNSGNDNYCLSCFPRRGQVWCAFAVSRSRAAGALASPGRNLNTVFVVRYAKQRRFSWARNPRQSQRGRAAGGFRYQNGPL
jgi:hypothetical protein